MRIIPDCSIKPLSECNPGQIVRNLSYNTTNYALVAASADGKANYLIFLTDEGPQYELISDAYDHLVLAYAGELVWEVNQDSLFERSSGNLFSASGALIRTVDDWLLNVEEYQARNRKNRGQFILGSGLLGAYREHHHNVGIFGAWRLFLHDEGTPFDSKLEIARFQWNAPRAAT